MENSRRQRLCSVFQRVFQEDDAEITRSGLQKRLDYHEAGAAAERRRVMLIIIILTGTTMIIANTFLKSFLYIKSVTLKITL